MELTTQLRIWGATHAQAREAEKQAHQQGSAARELRQKATALREQADRLHREIYSAIGGKAR